MPLSEVDLNVARQNSRSSDVSTSGRDEKSPSLGGTASKIASNSSNAAVFSMLKTTTETGDLGSFSMGSSRLPKLPRGLNRHPPGLPGNLAHSSSKASSRYSRNGSVHESIRSGKSQRSGREGSIPGAWPYGQYQYSTSQDFPHPPSEARSSIAQGSMRSGMMPGHDRYDPSERSHSLTRTLPYPKTFSDNRSVSSFRSQEPIPRSESPFVQASRLQQSRRRPSSPARSDTAGGMHLRRHVTRPRAGPRAHTAMGLPPQFASDYSQRAGPQYAVSPPPPPNPRFRPSRTIEDLRRPFVTGGQASNVKFNERSAAPFRVPQPLPAQYRQVDYGPPLPHARMYNGSPPPHHYTKQATAPAYRPGPSDTTPYRGFVQRVKNALEERSSSEEMRPKLSSYKTGEEAIEQSIDGVSPKPSSHDRDPDESSASATEEEPLIRMEAEPESEVVAGSPSVKRLTRDMIKAGMDGMSDVVAMSDVAEEGMATSVLNMDEDQQSKKSGNESEASRDHVSEGVPITSNVLHGLEQPRENTDRDPTKDVSSPMGLTDPTNFTLRMSKQHIDDAISPRSEIETSNTAMNLTSANGMRARFFTDDSTSPGSSTRHASMPMETMPTSRSQRNTIAKSMPVPAWPQAPTIHDLDDQRAIRLSSIEPKARDHNAADADRTSGIYPSSAHPSIQLNGQSDITIGSSMHDGHETILIPASSARSSISVANEQSETSVSPTKAVNSPAADILMSPSKRNATLIDTTRSTISTPSRTNPHLVDSRISAMKNFHFPMPDLTEDSQEDASTTNLRILGMRAPMGRPRPPKDFHRQQPIPARMSAPAPDETSRSYLKRAAADLQHIPSFNFSRVDLTTKLNNALGLRFSRSAGDLIELTSSSVAASLPDRPMSQILVRETYRSFFAASEVSVEEEVAPVERSTVKSIQIDEDILSEIEMLSIPSVKHLTARLSELLPSIKQSRSELDLEMVDAALRQTVLEIRQLGSLDDPVDSTNKHETASKTPGTRTNSPPLTRLGTINSRTTTTSDRRVRPKSLLHLMKELPPLPKEGRHHRRDKSVLISVRTSSITSGGQSSPGEVSELEGTAVEVTGSTEGNENAELAPVKAQRKGSLAKKISPSPGTTSRPWNKSESYPWTTEAPAVDITVSTDDNQEDEDAYDPRPSSTRIPRPSADTVRHDSMRIVRSMSPGFDADLVPATDKAALLEVRASSKNGLLGSMARKMGLKPRTEKAGFAVDPLFFHPEEHSVGAGDRYPTTSLTSPIAGLALDEGRSYFSDDSSLSDHARAGLRKRLTRLRPRLTLPNVGSPAPSPAHSRSDVHRPDPIEDAAFNDTQPAMHRSIVAANEQPVVGMSKTEFRAKRLVEKFRTLLFRSSERLRHLGKNKKRETEWHDAVEAQPLSP